MDKMKERLFAARLLLGAFGLDMLTVSIILSEVDKMNFDKISFYRIFGMVILFIVCIWTLISQREKK